MNNKLAALLGFLFGGFSGAGLAWFLTNRVNEKKRSQEIQAVLATLASEEEEDKEPASEAEKQSYEEIVVENSYISTEATAAPEVQPVKVRYADKGAAKPKARTEKMFKPPYIIEDYEFDEENDYRKITLTYYADGKLVDEIGTNVEAEAILGDTLKSFGNGDALYVRNERLRCDYEVLKDDAKYSDIVARKPYLADDDDDAESE